jgi:hypothetical protein
MENAMMGPTERHSIFIADPAAKGARLDEPQMMGIGRPPPTKKARLPRHEPQVGAIPRAAGFAQRERALIDVSGNGTPDCKFARNTDPLRGRFRVQLRPL